MVSGRGHSRFSLVQAVLHKCVRSSSLEAVAMHVMINATGCPAPALDRNRMKTHKHLSQLIASAIDHDLPTPV